MDPNQPRPTPADATSQRREQLIGRLRDGAPGAIAPRPTSLHAPRPLRRAPGPVTAKLAARSRAGLSATGSEYPSERLWSAVVLPTGVVAALDAVVGGALALTTGMSPLLFIIWIVLFVGCGGAAVAAGLRLAHDPLRLSMAERREIERTRHWESRQPWSASTAAGQERRLVDRAAATVRRVVTSSAWESDHLDDHRVQLDLGAELDEIDAQAFRLANLTTRRQPGEAGAPDRGDEDAARDALLDRVTALDEYAEQLVALERRLAARRTAQAVESDDALPELSAGTVRDEFAAADLRSLTDDLRGAGDEVDQELD